MTCRVCSWSLEVSVLPMVQVIGLVKSSWSDKQHFHSVVALTQQSLAHREKKRMSGFKTMHMASHSGRPFERVYTMSVHQRAFLQLMALENLQRWKRGKLSHELIFWSHSKFLFWQTAPTSWPEWGWPHVHWLSRQSRGTSFPWCCTQHLLLAPCHCCTFSPSSGSHQYRCCHL